MLLQLSLKIKQQFLIQKKFLNTFTAYNKTTFNTRHKIHFALRARNILTNFRHSQARGENDFPYSQGRRENC